MIVFPERVHSGDEGDMGLQGRRRTAPIFTRYLHLTIYGNVGQVFSYIQWQTFQE